MFASQDTAAVLMSFDQLNLLVVYKLYLGNWLEILKATGKLPLIVSYEHMSM